MFPVKGIRRFLCRWYFRKANKKIHISEKIEIINTVGTLNIIPWIKVASCRKMVSSTVIFYHLMVRGSISVGRQLQIFRGKVLADEMGGRERPRPDDLEARLGRNVERLCFYVNFFELRQNHDRMGGRIGLKSAGEAGFPRHWLLFKV
jgi:hypothetical protein